MKLMTASALIFCTKGEGGLMPYVGRFATEGGRAVLVVTDFPGPCGLCTSKKNPMVQAAKGKPMPCLPLPSESPMWKGASSVVKVDKHRVLLSSSTCKCAWDGTIKFLPFQDPDHVNAKK